ncbi:MAG: nucleotidyltransferase domain-containing protein [Candidatus Bathyarchaeia archaeon]
MSLVIPVRVPREIAQKIKRLVDAGIYANRSILIREALRRLIVSEGVTAQRGAVGRVVATVASAMIAWNEKAVTDVILFGSVARGEAAVESDVDLLVLVEKTESWVARQRLYDIIYPVIPALGIDVSLIVIDRKHFVHMVEEGDPFAISVVREGVQLHGGLLDEYSKSAFRKGG